MIKPTIVLEYSHLSCQGSSVLLCVMLPSNMGIKSPKPKPYYFQKRFSLEGQRAALGKDWCPGRSSVICLVFRGFRSIWSSTAHPAAAEAVEGNSDEYILQTSSALQLLRRQFFNLYSPLFKYGSVDLFLISPLLDKGYNFFGSY